MQRQMKQRELMSKQQGSTKSKLQRSDNAASTHVRHDLAENFLEEDVVPQDSKKKQCGPIRNHSKKRRADFVFPEYKYPGKPPRNGDRSALKAYLQRDKPHEIQRRIFFEDDDFVVVYDAFPKSSVHLLIMPKQQYIKGISALTPEHIPVIHGMLDISQKLISHFFELGLEIWHGFHAIPSLAPLHLHLVSTDFSMPALKKNIHWNSFTTAFFVAPESVLSTLESGNSIFIDKQIYKAIKNRKPLLCPKCLQTFRIKKIQLHWARCKAPLQQIDRDLVWHT